jgi:hypothetical protein
MIDLRLSFYVAQLFLVISTGIEQQKQLVFKTTEIFYFSFQSHLLHLGFAMSRVQ